MDPVDNTSMTPQGPDWPSAAQALAKAGRPFGMTGAPPRAAVMPLCRFLPIAHETATLHEHARIT